MLRKKKPDHLMYAPPNTLGPVTAAGASPTALRASVPDRSSMARLAGPGLGAQEVSGSPPCMMWRCVSDARVGAGGLSDGFHLEISVLQQAPGLQTLTLLQIGSELVFHTHHKFRGCIQRLLLLTSYFTLYETSKISRAASSLSMSAVLGASGVYKFCEVHKCV